MDLVSFFPTDHMLTDASVGAHLACALFGAALLSALPIGAAVLAGFVMSVFQTATQLQDPALTYIPKALAASVVMMLLFPGGLESLAEWFAWAIQTTIRNDALIPR